MSDEIVGNEEIGFGEALGAAELIGDDEPLPVLGLGILVMTGNVAPARQSFWRRATEQLLP